MTDAAKIAASLTEKQREALLSFPASEAQKEFHEHRHAACYHGLCCRGLIQACWAVFPHQKPWKLTPLGLAVRAHIMENTDAK